MGNRTLSLDATQVVAARGLRMAAGALLSFFGVAWLTAFAQLQVPTGEWKPVAEALGRAGEEQDGVYRISFPRTDLRVRVEGVTVRPALALTTWIAFQKAGAGAVMMGDLVLESDELEPIVTKLTQAGIAITGIHNHLAGESPRVIYVHFHGHGVAVELARVVRGALELTKTPTEIGTPAASPGVVTITDQLPPSVDRLSETLGHRGRTNSGVTQFSIPRAEQISAGGMPLGPRMGVATAISFQSVGASAVTAGDFVLLPSEVQPVIRVLAEHHIQVTALHNHLLDEEPRLAFLHFWGRADAVTLAQGLRVALDRTNHVKASPAAR